MFEVRAVIFKLWGQFILILEENWSHIGSFIQGLYFSWDRLWR